MMYIQQKGAATLTVVVLLLTLASCSSFYWLGISQLNLHIVMNTQNKAIAYQAAYSGLHHSLSQLNSLPPEGYDTDISSSEQAFSYQSSIQRHISGKNTLGGILAIESRGELNKRDVTAVTSQRVLMVPLIAQTPIAPLTVAGNLINQVGLTLVANPNGAGINMPLSIWTNTKLNDGNSLPTSCHIYEFRINHCTDEYLSKGNHKGDDIVDNVMSFPNDILNYMTGIHLEEWFWLKDEMDIFREGCDHIETDHVSKIWVEGDCTISMGVHLGSEQKPILLVVQNGDLSIHGRSKVIGIILMLSNDSGRQLARINGQTGSKIQGALVSSQDIDFTNSHLNIIYDWDVIDRLVTLPSMQKPTPVLFSWRDH